MWIGLAWLALQMLVMSALTLGVFAYDKRQATRSGWRVPEKRLHLLALLGGWPGALLGQRWLRHKSSKTRFRVTLSLMIIGHVLWVGGITWALAQRLG